MQIDGEEGRILALLSVACGTLIHPDVIRNFRNASRALAKGEKTLAAIHLCHAGLPEFEGDDRKVKLLFQASQLLDDGLEPGDLLKGLDLLPEAIDGAQWSKFVKTVISCQGEARDDHGRWTTGGESENAVQDASVVPAAGQTDPTQAKKERFVAEHLSDAQKGADQLGVPVLFKERATRKNLLLHCKTVENTELTQTAVRSRHLFRTPQKPSRACVALSLGAVERFRNVPSCENF